MAHSAAAAAVLSFLVGVQACAQLVISARAGLIHHTEGRVFLNQKPLVTKIGHFSRIGENDLFRTGGRGRAEILLSPGVFLRLGPDTSIRLLSSEITDARVELVSGEVVLEAVNLRQVKAVTLTLGKIDVSTNKKGQFHLEANPPGLRVFDGKAVATAGGQQFEVKKGREVRLDETLTARTFNPVERDLLDRWSDRRSQLLESDNIELLRPDHRPADPGYHRADEQISGLDAAERTTRPIRTGARGRDR